MKSSGSSQGGGRVRPAHHARSSAESRPAARCPPTKAWRARTSDSSTHRQGSRKGLQAGGRGGGQARCGVGVGRVHARRPCTAYAPALPSAHQQPVGQRQAEVQPGRRRHHLWERHRCEDRCAAQPLAHPVAEAERSGLWDVVQQGDAHRSLGLCTHACMLARAPGACSRGLAHAGPTRAAAAATVAACSGRVRAGESWKASGAASRGKARVASSRRPSVCQAVSGGVAVPRCELKSSSSGSKRRARTKGRRRLRHWGNARRVGWMHPA